MIRLNDDVMIFVKPLSNRYSGRRDRRCGRDGSGQTCVTLLRKKNSTDIDPAGTTSEDEKSAAAPRAAQAADGRRGASGRHRKSVSRAKTAGAAHRPIDGERSASNVLVSLDPEVFGNDVERLCHHGDVFESRSYASREHLVKRGLRFERSTWETDQNGRASSPVQMTVQLKYRYTYIY